MTKWKSLHDIINDDRDKKDFTAIPRYGEVTSAKYIKPKTMWQHERIKNILYAKMKYDRFYQTQELCKMLNISIKNNLARELQRYPEMFERVGKGVWRLK